MKPMSIIILGALFACWSSIAYGDVKTSSTSTKTTEREQSVVESSGLFALDGFGPSASVSFAACTINGQCSILSSGIGFGVSYKFNASKASRFPLELALEVAPIVRTNGASTFAEFAVMVRAAVYKGFGALVGWRWYRIGDDGGFQAPRNDTIFFSLAFGPTNDGGP